MTYIGTGTKYAVYLVTLTNLDNSKNILVTFLKQPKDTTFSRDASCKKYFRAELLRDVIRIS